MTDINHHIHDHTEPEQLGTPFVRSDDAMAESIGGAGEYLPSDAPIAPEPDSSNGDNVNDGETITDLVKSSPNKKRVPRWAWITAAGVGAVGIVGAAVGLGGGGDSTSKSSNSPVATAEAPSPTNDTVPATTLPPNGVESNNLGDTPEYVATVATGLWNAAANYQWVNGSHDAGINYPANTNQVHPDGKQFSEQIQSDWENRFSDIVGGSTDQVQILHGVKLFFSTGGKIIEVENPVIYGVYADSAGVRRFDAAANSPSGNYQNYAITFALPSGEWATITLQHDGVGWQTVDDMKFVGLMKDPAVQSPVIVAGAPGITGPNGFTVVGPDGSTISSTQAAEFSDIQTAAKTVWAQQHWDPMSLWALTDSITK